MLIYCTCLPKWSVLWAKLVFIIIPLLSCSEGTQKPLLTCHFTQSSVFSCSVWGNHLTVVYIQNAPFEVRGCDLQANICLEIFCFGELVSSNQEEKVETWVGDKVMPTIASFLVKSVIYCIFSCCVNLIKWLFWRKTIVLTVATIWDETQTLYTIQIQETHFRHNIAVTLFVPPNKGTTEWTLSQTVMTQLMIKHKSITW